MFEAGYAPYRLEDLFSGTRTPSSVKNNSYALHFWRRALYQRLCSIVEFDLPESWNRARDFFEACLFSKGFVAVFDSLEFGKSFQPANISGYDFYYQPTRAIVSNPLFNKEFTIGEDCSLIKLTPDFQGVLDVINYYAEKLATIDGAVNMSIINSKFAYVIAARGKANAQAVKMIFDKINEGEPTVIYDKAVTDGLGEDSPFEFLDRGAIKNSYITSDLLQDARTILNQFDQEIGIPTLGAGEKKERMITAEAEAKDADTSARVTLWDECLKNSIAEVNSMFDLNIGYKFKWLDKMDENSGAEAGADDSAPDESIKEVLKRWALA